jgi:hypothetical protein
LSDLLADVEQGAVLCQMDVTHDGAGGVPNQDPVLVQVRAEEYDEAIPYFEQALDLRRELWAADRSNDFARNGLAYMLIRLGETLVLAGRPSPA